LPAGNVKVQLLTINMYTDPERHSVQRYRRTDGRTDDIMMRAVRSAKNREQLGLHPWPYYGAYDAPSYSLVNCGGGLTPSALKVDEPTQYFAH